MNKIIRIGNAKRTVTVRYKGAKNRFRIYVKHIKKGKHIALRSFMLHDYTGKMTAGSVKKKIMRGMKR